MFALPGICGLVIFILIRPQESIGALAGLPLLHACAGLALLGFIVDLRLRRLEPRGVPSLPWVAAFAVWVLLCNAVRIPDQFTTRATELAILLVIYGTIAHACQRFRALQLVTGVVMSACLMLAAIGIHQHLQPRQCIVLSNAEGTEGDADGRLCDDTPRCYDDLDGDPAANYRCERAGVLGTHSIQDRIRYRGELHDPNELALTLGIGGLSFVIASFLRRRGGLGAITYLAAAAMVAWAVLLTQSRGGLVVAAAVPGVYFVRRFGVAGLFAGLLAAAPVMMLGGGGRDAASAETSTLMRYEAWASGLDMFHSSPLFGVGQRQFTEHHFLTAHNTYVLTLAELGLVGMVLFVMILWASIKALYVGVRQLDDVPGARVARVWGMAMLASMLGLAFQIQTLSFAYHSVLWIFVGLAGAWVSAVRRHLPRFEVQIGLPDVAVVASLCTLYALVILPVFLRIKGAM
ncbi:MAG: O-antigen ligase family protein [Kofleriaceae bacterium]